MKSLLAFIDFELITKKSKNYKQKIIIIMKNLKIYVYICIYV